MSEPGKAARNEQRKIRATFWNNLAVAAVVAGVLGPYLSFYTATGGRPYFGRDGWSTEEVLALVGIASAAFVSLVAAWWFRGQAHAAAGEIED